MTDQATLDRMLSVELASFMLVFMRVLGLMLFAPLFSSPVMPITIRFYLVMAISMMLAGRFSTPVEDATTMVSLVMIMGSELLVGLILGSFLQFVFAGLQLAGHTTGTQLGLALASVVNPQFDDQASTTSVVYATVASLIFFGTGLDREVFRVLLDTFEVIPLGGATATPSILEFTMIVLQQSMVFAVRVAAPVTLALFLAELALGFVGRTVPQLNVLSIGFSIRIVLGLTITTIGLSETGQLFVDAVGEAVVESVRALSALAPAGT